MFDTRGVVFVKERVPEIKTAMKKYMFLLGYIEVDNPEKARMTAKKELLEFFLQEQIQWTAIIPADLSRLYEIGLAVSKNLQDTTVISFRKEYDDTLNFKIYHNGQAMFKYGEAPDYEVPYLVPESNDAVLKEFLDDTLKVNPVIGEKIIQKLKGEDIGFPNFFITSLNIVFTLPKFNEIQRHQYDYMMFSKEI